MNKRRLIFSLFGHEMTLSLILLFSSAVCAQEDQGLTVKDESVVVVIGASYARHWGVSDLGGVKIVNKGVDGEQTSEMLRRFQDDVIEQKPGQVLIWGFINNIHRNPRERIEKTIEEIKKDFSAMVDTAKRNGVTPIVATEITIRQKAGWQESVKGTIGSLLGKESYQDFVNDHVQFVNSWLREWAQRNGIAVLDFENVLAAESGERRKEYATPDGTHISDRGYAALSRYALTYFPRRDAPSE